MTLPFAPTRSAGLSLRERKTVAFKDASVSSSGYLEGYGAVYGNVDEGGDEIVHGALSRAIPEFLKSGFVSWNHDWGSPVAMPLIAREDPQGLYLVAQFHTDPASQDARTITRERLDGGMSMGLSIGYGDVKAERLPDRRRLLEIGRLYEVGLVMVPMNRLATVADAKSQPAARPDTAPMFEYVQVPAGWMGAAALNVAERTWWLAAAALGLPPVPMAIHYFADEKSRDGIEAKRRGWKSMRQPQSMSGFVYPERPTEIWAKGNQSFESLAWTIGHEAYHLAEFRQRKTVNQAEADRFGHQLLSSIGGVRSLLG